MPSYVTPKKGVAFRCYAGLVDQANPSLFKANPTLASGDFKVSIDGGALANLATLPAVTPASSRMIQIDLSTSETNGDNITVVGVDAAGAEWGDLILNIQTTARQVDDLAFPTVSGRGLDVSAGGEAGVDWANVGSPTTALDLSGTTIKTSQVVASVTGAVGSVTGAVGSVTGAVGSVTGAVASVTGNVGGNVVGSVASVTGNVGGTVASVVGAVGSVSGNVTGSVGSLAAQAKADVNAEVVDVIRTDTIPELAQAAPAATPTVATAVMLLYQALRNEITVTSSSMTISNDAGVVITKKALADSGTQYTESEMVAGP
jgi:hypothetical protein